jgi:hypothetical protein
LSVSGRESVPSLGTIPGGGYRVLEMLGFGGKYRPDMSGPCFKHASLRTHPMPSRTIQESHRPRVSDRTMRCHSLIEWITVRLVRFRKRMRRHDWEMEPQGRGSVSPLYKRRRNRTLRLRKTTRESRVHVQTVGLNAEKIFRHRAEGEILLLTFLFIGLVRQADYTSK